MSFARIPTTFFSLIKKCNESGGGRVSKSWLHHERHLWPGAAACVDVVPEILGIACIAKFTLENGGGCRAVGLGDICLRTIGNIMNVTSGTCVDVIPETLGIAWSALGNGGQGQAVGKPIANVMNTISWEGPLPALTSSPKYPS